MPASPVGPESRSAASQSPLAGKRIVVTREASRAPALVGPLEALGAEVLTVPVTRIETIDPAGLEAALDRLREYDWVVFTSATAARLVRAALGARTLEGVHVAAVGPATATALRDSGAPVTVVAEQHTAEGLVEAIAAHRGGGPRPERVLHVTAEGAREVLSSGLAAVGATVDVVVAYRSVPDLEHGAALRERIGRGAVDLVTVLAPSAVRAYVAAVGAAAARAVPVAAIGPVTSAAALELGLTVEVEAAASTSSGLVDAIVRWAGAGHGGTPSASPAPVAESPPLPIETRAEGAPPVSKM